MYYHHFGLQQPPFRITPDTRLFFPGGNRGAVLEALVYAIVNGEGIVKVVGEVGSGKTMLCRMLEKELPENVDIVYLANPSVAPDQVLYAIAFELKLPVTAADDRLSVMQILQEFLIKRHADNRRVVVFVEEAQSMPVATLEEIRLLSNLETSQDKLLQIVLFGQPELDGTLAQHDIRQLKERITYSFNLPPFQEEDIRDYINSRLRANGFRAGEVFTRRAVKAIGRYSRGLVRRINILADKAMLAAYADNAAKVAPKHVRTAAADSEFEAAPGARNVVLAVAAAGLFLVLGALIWMRMHPAAGAGPAGPGVAAAASAAAPALRPAQPAQPPLATAAATAAGAVRASSNAAAAPPAPTAQASASPAVPAGSNTGPGEAAATSTVATPREAPQAAASPLPASPVSNDATVAVAGRATNTGGADTATGNRRSGEIAGPADPLRRELMTNADEEPAVSPLVDIRHISAGVNSGRAAP